MDSQNLAHKSTIQIANIDVDGYKLTDGSWCLSLRGLASILNKDHKGVGNFFNSTLPKVRPDMDLRVGNINLSSGSQLRMVTVEMATEYLTHWAFKGDKKAQQLVKAFVCQSLELRLEASLPSVTPEVKEAVSNVVEKYPDVKALRELHRNEHNHFQTWMKSLRFSLANFHDKLTLSLYGLTAKELREKYPEVFAGNEENIGICHLQKEHYQELHKLIEVKRYLRNTFFRRRKYFTSDQEYINQAMDKLNYKLVNI